MELFATMVCYLALLNGIPYKEPKPDVNDLKKFPSKEVALSNVEFIEAHAKWLVVNKVFIQDGQEWENEAYLHGIEWIRLLWAHEALYRGDESEASDHLHTMRKEMGPRYYSACLLPPAPIHRFKRK